jgi:hypothetical protein
MTDAKVSDFYEALKPWGHSAFSCNGVNLFGDRDSIKAAVSWEHRSHQAGFFQNLAIAEKERADKLEAVLLTLHQAHVASVKPGTAPSGPLYEEVCKVLGLPTTVAPRASRYRISPDAGNKNCRRIHGPNSQVCKVYAWDERAGQLRAEQIVRALEQYHEDI